jgi:hypothetical protein
MQVKFEKGACGEDEGWEQSDTDDSWEWLMIYMEMKIWKPSF